MTLFPFQALSARLCLIAVTRVNFCNRPVNRFLHSIARFAPKFPDCDIFAIVTAAGFILKYYKRVAVLRQKTGAKSAI
jgi:hypothetical protein